MFGPWVRADLTPLGSDLVPLMQSLRRWAETNMDRVQAARDAYDAGSHVGAG